MHALEHALMLLSQRIARGTESPAKLAADCGELAGISHLYVPENSTEFADPAAALSDAWSKKYADLSKAARQPG